ncbi:MAG: hypothetical protein HN961_05960, partial [Planctomycetes bacterium]|nr:hypothetical protein [Planctomycetota bacterium]
MKVPFFDVRYNLGDEDKKAILERWSALLDHGSFVNGPEIAELESALASFLGIEHVVACSNGSDALVLALRACDIGPGDEVILPAFTFFATAGAVARIGAVPVFADVAPVTYLMTPETAAARASAKTKAILPVHLYGCPLDVSAVRAAVESVVGHSVMVVEDSAQAVGAVHETGTVGALGDASAFSCYPTKNLGATGDAGFVTTLDAERADRMRALRQHGGGRAYFHDEVGFNFRQSGLQAAALLHHLPRLTEHNTARRCGAEHYYQLASDLGLGESIQMPQSHPGHVFHQFVIRTPQRDA